MNFMQWYYVGQGIASQFLMTNPDAPRVLEIEWYTGLGVGLALWLLLTVLGGFGLLGMAKGQGRKDGFFGFIPVVNIWYAAVLAGDVKVAGKKFRFAGLFAAISEALCLALGVMALAIDYELIPYAESELLVEIAPRQYYTYFFSAGNVPPELGWMYAASYGIESLGVGWLTILSDVLGLCAVVFEVFVLIALFKKYSPGRFAIYTVLCVLFPCREIVFFLLRKRKPIDYDEFLRRRAQYYTPAGPSARPAAPPEEPFRDFADPRSAGSDAGNHGNQDSGDQGNSGSNDSPFSDF